MTLSFGQVPRQVKQLKTISPVVTVGSDSVIDDVAELTLPWALP